MSGGTRRAAEGHTPSCDLQGSGSPGSGAGVAVSKAVVMHPRFNTRALTHRNVSEFYDYDVALIQLNQSIPLSWRAR